MNNMKLKCYDRRYLTALIASILVLAPPSQGVDTAGATRQSAQDIQDRTIQVPVDHGDPALGFFPLYYELGAPFDPNRPTVLVVTDAQQFYVRKGTVSRVQSEIFGPGLNVVGIPGRGTSDEILSQVVGEDGEVDWPLAYRLLKSSQWVEDIERVRRDLLGPGAPLMLYGRSGGGHLLHEYLVKYGGNVDRAFSQAACNAFLDAEYGLQSDRFWEEIGTYDPSLQEKLLQVLARRTNERPEIVQLFQRQNFFVSSSGIASARGALIEDLYEGQQERVTELRESYQVDAVQHVLKTPIGVGIRDQVSVFEDAMHPDIENTFQIAQPLIQLRESGRLPALSMDFGALHKIQTEVFVLAARWDHTCDYRSQIALSSHYSPRTMFLADDGHMFDNINESHAYPSLVRAFLHHGVSSPETMDVLRRIDHLRWREQ
jgi:hypothetical protein